jgi:hypothetical protein
MRRDLMERLAAADPLRDGEQLDADAQREAEALLARIVATPPEPIAKPRLRRWIVPAVAAACAAAVAAVVFVGSDVDQAVAARSAAALSRDDSVYHIVERRTVTGIQGPTTVPVFIESWYASDGRFHEKFFEDDGGRRGRLLEEAAGKRPGWVLRWHGEQNELFAGGIGGGQGELPVIDPAGDPGATLRALEARGALKLEGSTRDGYRLVSDPVSADDGEYRFEYEVDRETYLPREQRWSLTRGSETIGIVKEFRLYERLPLDAAGGAQLDLDPHPDASCSAEANQPSRSDLGFVNPCRDG